MNLSDKGHLPSKALQSNAPPRLPSVPSFSKSSFLTSMSLSKLTASTPKLTGGLSGLTFTPVPPTVEVQSHARSDKEEAESSSGSNTVSCGLWLNF